MALQLPTPTAEVYRQDVTVTLEGSSYQLTFEWLARDSHWYLSIATIEGTAIATSLRMVLGVDLLSAVSNESAPPGALIIASTVTWSDGAGYGDIDPGADDWADENARLIYLTAAEVAAL